MSDDEDEAAQARDGHLIAAIAVVLTSGHAVENERGDVRLDRASDGRYGVLCMIEDLGIKAPRREHFDDVHQAVRYYLDLCES